MALGSLAQRVLTALVMLALLLPAFLLLPKAFGLLLVTLFVLGGAWEWSAFVATGRAGPRAGWVALLVAAMAVLYANLDAPGLVRAVLLAACAWWAVAFVLVLRFPVRFSPAVAAVCGLLVLLPAWVALASVLAADPNGRGLLLLVVAVTSAADVGAYFAGRGFGRVKLAPAVSPGKTWEGAIGGLVAASLVGLAGAGWLGSAPMAGILLGLCVGSVSIVGDLTVSMFKRNSGIKDSGKLFPGHGGILDRVDSLTAAAPLFALIAGWLGWLAA